MAGFARDILTRAWTQFDPGYRRVASWIGIIVLLAAIVWPEQSERFRHHWLGKTVGVLLVLFAGLAIVRAVLSRNREQERQIAALEAAAVARADIEATAGPLEVMLGDATRLAHTIGQAYVRDQHLPLLNAWQERVEAHLRASAPRHLHRFGHPLPGHPINTPEQTRARSDLAERMQRVQDIVDTLRNN